MGVRNYPDVPRVYIDMDGPMADLEAAAAAAGLHPKDFKNSPNAYRNLPLVAGALDAIAAFESRGLLVFLLSKVPRSNPLSATDKLLWVQDVAPHLLDRVILSSDKGCVGTPRDFVIDDHPEWANCDQFPGTILRFENNWAEMVAGVFAVLDWPGYPLLDKKQPVESINSILEKATGWRIDTAKETPNTALHLYRRTGLTWRRRLLIATFPRETPVSVLVSIGHLSQLYYQLGFKAGRRHAVTTVHAALDPLQP